MLIIFSRPALTIVGALAILIAALGQLGCAATKTAEACDGCTSGGRISGDRFELDRQAILGMAGEYDVSFDFEETIAVREGYELQQPYHSEASELVVVIEDTGEFISLQHLLVVSHDGETHVIKHWRQDWRYQATEGYDFQGENIWEPVVYGENDRAGAWVQSVYQVDDSPRYWGVGRWQHRNGVSTWTSSPTNRPLPRREFSQRSDYQVVGAVNTHVVTADGWMHYQNNHKIDKTNAADPVIVLESGVNTYTRTTQTDFSSAREYWENTSAYWAEVRAAWSDVYDQRETVRLKSRWKGDAMYAHMFDLADQYWGNDDASSARSEIDEVINAFIDPETVALP